MGFRREGPGTVKGTGAANGELNKMYKDRGGPAQLGTRDWAGLKGHGDERHLARYGGQKRADPGKVRSYVRRHRAPKSGTWVDYYNSSWS